MHRSSVIVDSFRLISITLVLASVNYVHAQKSIGLIPPRHSISVLDSTKEQDGLVGAVRRVKTESTKVELKDGQIIEGPMQLLELTTYSIKGARLENVSYPASDPQVGKEEYKYDEHGNIIEMTLRDDRGAIASKESYTYEFDANGNWTKMSTSLVLFENGKLKREPIENTYRTITYYFTDNVAKIVDSAPRSLAPSLPPAESRPANLGGSQLDVDFSSQRISSSKSDLGTAPSLMVKRNPVRSVPNQQSGSEEDAKSLSVASNPENTEASNGGGRLLRLKKAPDSAENQTFHELPNNNSTSAEGSSENITPNAASAPESATQREAMDLYGKGLESVEKGELQMAIGAFLGSIKLQPSAEVYLNLGNAYLKTEKNNDAAKAFKESVKLNPDGAEAQYGLGLSNFRLKRFVEARNAFVKAANLQPTMAKAHYGLGLTLLEMGQPDAVTKIIRVLENLDKTMARNLSRASPTISFSCRFNMRCQ
jgi:tetratricopeptide (TPR) repeat protein